MFDEMVSGTKLVGEAQVTGLWPKKFKPASMIEEDLSTVSKAQRPAVTFQSFGFMEEDVLQAVWAQTMDEVEAGELSQPICIEDVPDTCPISKRFGVKQASKVRCVDDFT